MSKDEGPPPLDQTMPEWIHELITLAKKDFPEPDKTHPPVEAIKTRICNRPNQNAIIEAPLWVIDVSMFAIPGHTPASTKSTDLRQSLGTALTGITRSSFLGDPWAMLIWGSQ